MIIIHSVINTLLGGLTIDPAGMHCPSWDDAFVSNLYCFEIWRTRSTRRRSHMCQILVDRFTGVTEFWYPQNCHFPLTCCVALTTVYALPCEIVIKLDVIQLRQTPFINLWATTIQPPSLKAWRNSATTNPIHKSVGYNQPPAQPIRTLMNVTQYPLRFRVPKSVLRWISLTRIVNRGIDYARDWPELFANGRKYARMIRYRSTSSPKHPATGSVAADHYQSSFASS